MTTPQLTRAIEAMTWAASVQGTANNAACLIDSIAELRALLAQPAASGQGELQLGRLRNIAWRAGETMTCKAIDDLIGSPKESAKQKAVEHRAALELALRVALAPPPVTELPMQPIVWAADGCIRFKENRLVRKLLEHSRAHGFGLNELAMEDATEEERMQLAQLIGYSVSGYGGLSYVTDESADKSQDIADAMIAASQAGAQEPKP